MTQVPPEWAGVWVTTDSSYTCSPFALDGQPLVSTDTLCTGQELTPPPGAFTFTIDCTGTATPTEIHQHCTGSGEIITGCNVSIDIQIDGTRTADSYSVVNTTNITYSGPSCPLPPECFIGHVHGTRTDPEPTVWCATPVQPMTWGNVKATYR